MKLVPQESQPIDVYGQNAGYGVVEFHGQRVRTQYNPALWDALRSKKKNNRQKKIIQRALGGSK